MSQFVPIAPCAVAEQHPRESGSIFVMPALEIFVCIDKMPSQSSLLWSKQAQLSEPCFIREVFQS